MKIVCIFTVRKTIFFTFLKFGIRFWVKKKLYLYIAFIITNINIITSTIIKLTNSVSLMISVRPLQCMFSEIIKKNLNASSSKNMDLGFLRKMKKPKIVFATFFCFHLMVFLYFVFLCKTSRQKKKQFCDTRKWNKHYNHTRLHS